MTTKLTLTVEKDVIEGAKSYAKVSGRSYRTIWRNNIYEKKIR
jgi:hypothetical protein